MEYKIIHGDSVKKLKELTDNSIDSVVTDPPYELGFMGKEWDRSGIANNAELWKEVMRVLKPGGHMLAFSGTRTYHRMVCAIEDAGFQIRDQIAWVYGSGFPKSQNVGKAIDKMKGANRKVVGKGDVNRASKSQIFKVIGDYSGPAKDDRLITEPATDEAKKWDGWGTALKPAMEPIVLARKPLSESTIAKNVIKYNTGAINIDGTRIATDEDCSRKGYLVKDTTSAGFGKGLLMGGNGSSLGRWPANLIHDGSDEVCDPFPNGAVRFFYSAKSSKQDRNEGCEELPKENYHPTVKPTSLMRYLCKLITPPNGTILDPFMGSGSTGKAAILEGFVFIGIDLTKEYIPIATARIEKAKKDYEKERAKDKFFIN